MDARPNFVHHFAADVDPVRARVRYAVQQPLDGSAFTDVTGVPAGKSLPSCYLVAAQDQAIPPDAGRRAHPDTHAAALVKPSARYPGMRRWSEAATMGAAGSW